MSRYRHNYNCYTKLHYHPLPQQDWLRADTLLPHQTVEKLTKWTVYEDGNQARTVPTHNGRGPWESEDPAQDMLESRLNNTTVLRLFWLYVLNLQYVPAKRWTNNFTAWITSFGHAVASG